MLNDPGSCIINGGKTIKHSKLERVISKGYLLPACLFVFILKIVFIFIRNSSNIKTLTIFFKAQTRILNHLKKLALHSSIKTESQ